MASTSVSGKTWTRGLLGSLLDRFIAWTTGLPPETCNYGSRPYRIPVAEGIELAADLFLPDGVPPLGTILVYCPYGRGFPINATMARVFAARGYQILFVSCRGTHGSGGVFDPFRNEVDDVQKIVEWMRKQDWHTGTFATVGGSYMGYTQWALLCNPPNDLVTCIIQVGPHDFHRAMRGTGALNMDLIAWSCMVAGQEEPFAFPRMIFQPNRFNHILEAVPIAPAAEKAIGDKAPWLKNVTRISDPTDPYYKPMKLERAFDNVKIPILLISGWYDLFADQSMEQYLELRKRGCNVSLTMGNWTHSGPGFNQIVNQQSLSWLEEYLAKRSKANREAPMQYYVTGVDEWRHTADFPPSSKPYTLHLQDGMKLGVDQPQQKEGSSTFTFDPQAPTPAIGGNRLVLGKAGCQDDSALALRSDVLCFTTDALEEDVEVIGQPVVDLYHFTDVPHADIFARISEVDVSGKSHNITDGYQRLDPDRKDEIVSLPLNYCAHRFVKGTRIRLILAGGFFPHYARNIGTADPDNCGTEMKCVTHCVLHNQLTASKVVLPVSA